LQAHLKAAQSDALPKLLKELANTNPVTHIFIPEQFPAHGQITKH